MCRSGNLNCQNSKLKICYWKIHGCKSVIVPNKLVDREFLEKLKNSDIVAISETHTQNKDLSIPGYTLVKEKIRVKKHKGPKISGGLALFVKDYLYRSVHVVPNTNENTIWIKLKPKDTKISEDVYIGSFYVSPDNTLKNKRKTDL